MTVCLGLLCSCRVNWEQTDTWIRISTLKELKTSAQFYKYKNKMTFWGLSSSTPVLVEGARFSLQSASELYGCCNCCYIVCVRCCSTVNTCLMTKSGTLSLFLCSSTDDMDVKRVSLSGAVIPLCPGPSDIF